MVGAFNSLNISVTKFLTNKFKDSNTAEKGIFKSTIEHWFMSCSTGQITG